MQLHCSNYGKAHLSVVKQNIATLTNYGIWHTQPRADPHTRDQLTHTLRLQKIRDLSANAKGRERTARHILLIGDLPVF